MDEYIGKEFYRYKIESCDYYGLSIIILGYKAVQRHPVDGKMYICEVVHSSRYRFNKNGVLTEDDYYDLQPGSARDVYWKTVKYYSFESRDIAYKKACEKIEKFSENIVRLEAKKFDLLD